MLDIKTAFFQSLQALRNFKREPCSFYSPNVSCSRVTTAQEKIGKCRRNVRKAKEKETHAHTHTHLHTHTQAHTCPREQLLNSSCPVLQLMFPFCSSRHRHLCFKRPDTFNLLLPLCARICVWLGQSHKHHHLSRQIQNDLR